MLEVEKVGVRFRKIGLEEKIDKIRIDPMNKAFARTMEILTYIGLIMMLIPGIAYIFGNGGLISVEQAIMNWGKPASEFWTAVGVDPDGYSWFLDNLTYLDCLSILGIVFLAISPIVATISSLLRADTKYRIILTVVVIELVIAILRPLFMHTVGH